MQKLFLFALALFSLSACKKDLENTPSKVDLLTAQKWQLSAYTSTVTIGRTTTTTTSPASVTTTDKYASLASCEKDNFTKYNADKTIVQDEGPTKCYAYLAQKQYYTWEFNNDQTKIFTQAAIAGTLSPLPSTIVELSATTLRLRDVYSYTSGNVTTTTVDEVTYTAF
jgi:hypothetical protein